MAGFLGVHTDLTSKSHDLGGPLKRPEALSCAKKGASLVILVVFAYNGSDYEVVLGRLYSELKGGWQQKVSLEEAVLWKLFSCPDKDHTTDSWYRATTTSMYSTSCNSFFIVAAFFSLYLTMITVLKIFNFGLMLEIGKLLDFNFEYDSKRQIS